MPERIMVQRRLKDGGFESKYIMYNQPLTETLDKLRIGHEDIIAEKDQFLNPDDPQEALAKSAESYFTIDEALAIDSATATESAAAGGAEAAPARRQTKKIVVWTGEYIASKNTPVEPAVEIVSLKIVRKPEGLGGTDKTYKVKRPDLDNMMLPALRTALVERGYILAEDKFRDSGVVISDEREKSTKVNDLIDPAAPSIDLVSEKEAERAGKLDKWKDYVPEIKASDFKVDLTKPTLQDYKFTEDKTTTEGQGFGSVVVPIKSKQARAFSELSQDEQKKILKNCRLYPREGDSATCAALRMDNDIDFSGENIVLCDSIQMLSSNTSREDLIDFSYSEEISKWQTSLVEASN